MSETPSDEVMQFIAATHDWIVAVARKRYNADGRGMIQVEAPVRSVGIDVCVATELVY